jgi:hypothetical protein
VGAVLVAVVGVVTNRLPATCSLLSGSMVPIPTFWASIELLSTMRSKKENILSILI